MTLLKMKELNKETNLQKLGGNLELLPVTINELAVER